MVSSPLPLSLPAPVKCRGTSWLVYIKPITRWHQVQIRFYQQLKCSSIDWHKILLDMARKSMGSWGLSESLDINSNHSGVKPPVYSNFPNNWSSRSSSNGSPWSYAGRGGGGRPPWISSSNDHGSEAYKYLNRIGNPILYVFMIFGKLNAVAINLFLYKFMAVAFCFLHFRCLTLF